MGRREELLVAVNGAKYDKFVELIKLHNCRSDTYDLGETIQSLSRKQYVEMWDGISEMCTKIILSFDLQSELDDEDTQGEIFQRNSEVLSGVSTAALCSITQSEPSVTGSLLQVAVILHGILLAIPETCSKLQSQIAHLCETWFLAGLDGKDELVTCMLPYFIIKSLAQGAISDVKRLWSLRQGLLLIDFEDESSSSLKSLLQQCLIQPVYLKVEEGRRFLSYLFGMHPDFTEEIHRTIKNQIPSCPIATLSYYGEVYFRAWRAAKELYLEKIETYCVQDLMYHAIHAQRSGRHSMASRLKKVLGYFHQHKMNAEVDKTLLKLYEPILWRACKVANPSVRANAAAILFDVFPLQNPDANVAQTDQLLQRQFDVIGGFLDDPSPTVRAIAVHGVFHITSLFWELIPPHIVKELISKIFKTGAYDVSSTAVRVAVFQGINYVLNNRLCHPLLKTMLPNLKNLIHDNSEKVRIAFLDVLLKVKGMRGIKFWTITPMEYLLGRLEVEQSSPVIRRLVKLLMNSYHPTNKDNEELLTRCVGLWSANPQAARKFYQYAHLQMTLASSGKFLQLLCSYVLQCSRRLLTKEHCERFNDTQDIDKENDENLQFKTEGTNDQFAEVDISAIAGVLETCAIVWEGIKDQLEKPSQENLKSKIIQHFSKAVPKLFKSLQDSRCQSALTLLAANLSPALIPNLSRSCTSALSSMTDETTSDVYGPLLECLCSWDKASDVIELIHEKIETTLKDNLAQQSRTNRKRKSVNFSLPLTKSSLALDFLDWLMRSQTCRTRVFEVGEQFEKLRKTLSLSMDSIEVYLNDFPTSTAGKEKGEFLKKAFGSYCRLKIHLCAKESENTSDEVSNTCHENVLLAYEEVLVWCERVLLHHIDDSSSEVEDELEAKRGTRNLEWQPWEFVISILKNLLNLFSELVMIGLNKSRLNSSLAHFTSSLIKYEKTFVLLPEVAKLMYQIAQELTHQEDKATIDFCPVRLVFGNILNSATSCSYPNKLQVLLSLRPALFEILKLFYLNNHFISTDVNIALMKIIVETIVKELVAVLKQNPLITDESSLNNLPATSYLLLDLTLKSKPLFRIWVKEMSKFLTCGILQDVEYQATVYLFWTFINDGKFNDDMKPCWSEIEKALELMESEQHQVASQYIMEARRLVTECNKKLEQVTF